MGANEQPGPMEVVARDAATPPELIPAMGAAPIGRPIFFRSLYFVGPVEDADEALTELVCPVDPFTVARAATLRPAIGVLTVHRQTWTQTGMELGNLNTSICLAPGEVTRIALSATEHTVKGTGKEHEEQGEEVESQTAQQRTINDLQDAIIAETQSGSSSASASSVANQSGVSAGLLWGSVSSGSSSTTTSALTAQFSAGRRDLAAHSTNAIMQATAEKAHALRSKQQTVVREITEKEAETMSTRVLVNYNRRHALNVLFFQVLQVYDVKTDLVDWDRCLFVPMKPIHFADDASIKLHAPSLVSIYRSLKLEGMAVRIERFVADGKDVVMTPAEVERCRADIAGQIAERKAELHRGPIGGAAEGENLEAGIEPDSWGLLREQIKALEADLAKTMPAGISLMQILQEDRLFLNQQLWLRLSPDEVYAMLQGACVGGEPVVPRLDPHPIGVFGNYLGFRWGFPHGAAGERLRKDWGAEYLPSLADKDIYEGQATRIGLPGLGVFAEAVLGRGLAAEELNDRYAKWSDEENRIPILPPGIATLQHVDRSKATLDLKPTGDFAAALATLRSEKVADVSYLDKLLGVMSNGSMFRDMSNASKASDLAGKLADNAAAGATSAAMVAEKGWESIQDTFSKAFSAFMGSDEGKEAVGKILPKAATTKAAGGKPDGDAPGKPGVNPKPAGGDPSVTQAQAGKA